jgi:hypothetical protein
MMSQNLETTPADVFRRKLEEARERRQSEGFPMEFAGFPCKVRQLSRLHFIRTGRMPEYLTRLVIASIDRREEATATERQASAAEIVEGEVFMREAVCAVMVEPRVVASEPAPAGGYLYAELEENAPEFVQAVYQWVMQDCPAPEEEKGEGVLGVEDLARFPEVEAGVGGAEPRREGEVVGETAARTDAADGERPAGE